MRTLSGQVQSKGACFFINLAMLLVLAFLLSSRYMTPDEADFPKLVAVALLSVGLALLLFRASPNANRTVCLAGLGVFVALELMFRFVVTHDSNSGDDAVRIPRPYVVFGGRPHAEFADRAPMVAPGEKAEPIRLNHLGFRFKKALPLEKPEGEKRIFVLGGSSVFNGNPESQTIPSLLERQFHQRGFTEVQVYNFGSVSFVSGQELALLTHTLLDYRPDVVIAYDGGNDMMSPFFYDPRPGHPYNYRAFELAYEQIRGQPQGLTSSLASLFLYSRVVRTFFGRHLQNLVVRLGPLREQTDYGSDEWEQQVAERYVANLQKMASLAKGLDFQFIAILQPLVNLKNPRMGKEESLIGPEDFHAYVVRQYARVREDFANCRKDEFLQSNSLFLDCSGIMDGYEEDTYWDFIHTDNRGNEYIASQIHSRIHDWVIR